MNFSQTLRSPARCAVSALLVGVSLAAPSSADSPQRDRTLVEEIVVVASKTERPLNRIAAQVSTFDRARLDGEQVQDLGDVARYEPALEADFNAPRFGTTGLSIRGIGGNRVALEFDGVPLPSQFDIGNFADSSRVALDPAIVSRIEVLRGPASALYGSDAIGGVIVITSVDATDLIAPGRNLHLGGGGGYFGATDGTLARATGAWANDTDGLLLSVVHRRGHEPSNRSRGVEDDRLNLEQWQLFTKWTHDTRWAGTFRASADLYQRSVDSDLRALPGYERFADTDSILGDDQQLRGRLTFEHSVQQFAWLDEASLMFYVQDNRTEQSTDEFRTSRGVPVKLDRDFFFDERGCGSELRTRRDFDTGPVVHVVVAGLEWDRQDLEQRRDGTQTTIATGAQTKTLLGEEFPLRDLPLTTSDELGIYLQDEISYGAFTLIPGLRWDAIWLDARTDAVFDDPDRLTDLDNEELSLRLGLTWRALDRLTLYGSYAEGFRSPPAEDVNLYLNLPQFGVVSLPNPDLQPERSDNIEAGLRWRDDGLALTAGAYYANYDDFIESRARIGTDPDSGMTVFQSRNIEEATIYGVEADAVLDLFRLDERLAAWSLEAGVHWAEGENDGTNETLNTVAPLKLITGLRWRSLTYGLESGVRVTHLGRKSDVDRTGGDLFVPPSATVLDWTTRWDPTEKLDVVFGLYNLTNERYWRFSDVRNYDPGDPRVEIASRPGIHADLTVNFRF